MGWFLLLVVILKNTPDFTVTLCIYLNRMWRLNVDLYYYYHKLLYLSFTTADCKYCGVVSRNHIFAVYWQLSFSQASLGWFARRRALRSSSSLTLTSHWQLWQIAHSFKLVRLQLLTWCCYTLLGSNLHSAHSSLTHQGRVWLCLCLYCHLSTCPHMA